MIYCLNGSLILWIFADNLFFDSDICCCKSFRVPLTPVLTLGPGIFLTFENVFSEEFWKALLRREGTIKA